MQSTSQASRENSGSGHSQGKDRKGGEQYKKLIVQQRVEHAQYGLHGRVQEQRKAQRKTRDCLRITEPARWFANILQYCIERRTFDELQVPCPPSCWSGRALKWFGSFPAQILSKTLPVLGWRLAFDPSLVLACIAGLAQPCHA